MFLQTFTFGIHLADTLLCYCGCWRLFSFKIWKVWQELKEWNSLVYFLGLLLIPISKPSAKEWYRSYEKLLNNYVICIVHINVKTFSNLFTQIWYRLLNKPIMLSYAMVYFEELHIVYLYDSLWERWELNNICMC